MQPGLDLRKAAPAAYGAMLALESHIRKFSRLEPPLLELVRMRASQINGRALDAWRETPIFTDRERGALAWTEAVTQVSQGHVPDSVYDEVRQRFTEEEVVNLTLAVVAINGWNRLAISIRSVPGEYQPPSTAGQRR